MGLPVNLFYTLLRSFLTSVERGRPVMIAVLVANVANVGFDALFLFVFDWGAFGVGLASSLCWVVMYGVAWLAVRAEFKDAPLLKQKWDPASIRRILALGGPIGLHITAEVGMFSVVTFLIARLGETELAGHQIALTVCSLPFMMGLGLAVGATTRVGMHIGQNHSLEARRSGFWAMGMSAAVMGTGAVIFWLLDTPIAGAFSPHDAEVVEVGAKLLRVAAVFALSDGLQVVAAGALRGAGDTRWPFYASLFGYWGIGVPVAFGLGAEANWGSVGFWWGLTAGLTVVALLLALRFHVLSGRPMVRVEGSV